MPAALDPTGAPAKRLRPFWTLLTRPTWRCAPVLITGAVLAPGRRTVAAALGVAGRDWALGLAQYHRVLNRARWSRLAVARVLLELLAGAFLSAGPVVIGLHDALECRMARAVYGRGKGCLAVVGFDEAESPGRPPR